MNPGDKVTYAPDHGKPEHGIVKSVSGDGQTVFVVYHCNNDWARYAEFTGCGTRREDLREGWICEAREIQP